MNILKYLFAESVMTTATSEVGGNEQTNNLTMDETMTPGDHLLKTQPSDEQEKLNAVTRSVFHAVATLDNAAVSDTIVVGSRDALVTQSALVRSAVIYSNDICAYIASGVAPDLSTVH
jgi:hypothetical protein